MEKFKIVRVISEHKKISKSKPIKAGMKRVQAIVSINGKLVTRHIEIPK